MHIMILFKNGSDDFRVLHLSAGVCGGSKDLSFTAGWCLIHIWESGSTLRVRLGAHFVLQELSQHIPPKIRENQTPRPHCGTLRRKAAGAWAAQKALCQPQTAAFYQMNNELFSRNNCLYLST